MTEKEAKKAAAPAAPKTGVRVALDKDGKPKTVGNEELKAYDVRSVKDNNVYTFEGDEAARVAKCTTVVDGKVVPTYFTDSECEGPFAVGSAELKKAAADAAKLRAKKREENA